MKYLFGPVPSRRLGMSLGVDLVPFKTCSFDCLYCELGRTTCHTVTRDAYVPAVAVLAEVEEFFRSPSPAACDYVTLSGSGEPTLNRDLEIIVNGLRQRTEVPLALLSNSSLFHLPEVRRAVVGVDLILPSLDAVSEAVFSRLNRPVPGLTAAQVVAGLEALRREFSGQLWLEILFCQGINDSEAEIAGLREAVERIRPDRVQLNTVVRPAAYREARPVSDAFLRRLQAEWGELVEVVVPFRGPQLAGAQADKQAAILATLKRRPCTASDLAASCALAPAEVVKYLDRLQEAGMIRATTHTGETFYFAG